MYYVRIPNRSRKAVICGDKHLLRAKHFNYRVCMMRSAWKGILGGCTIDLLWISVRIGRRLCVAAVLGPNRPKQARRGAASLARTHRANDACRYLVPLLSWSLVVRGTLPIYFDIYLIIIGRRSLCPTFALAEMLQIFGFVRGTGLYQLSSVSFEPSVPMSVSPTTVVAFVFWNIYQELFHFQFQIRSNVCTAFYESM